MSPGGPGAEESSSSEDPAAHVGKSQRGRCQRPGQDPALSGPAPQRPLLDSDLLLPHFTQPPGRAFSHFQEGLPDVTSQGSRMNPHPRVWAWSLIFPGT